MKPRTLLTLPLAAAAVLATAGPAAAHHPEVVAHVGCRDASNQVQVFAEIRPWTSGPSGVHRGVLVELLEQGVWRQLGGLVELNGDTRLGIVRTAVVQSGDPVTVRATAIGPWGPDANLGNGGESRSVTTATTSYPCPPRPDTTRPPVVTIPVEPTPPTTVAPAPPTTMRPEVPVAPVPSTPPLTETAPEPKLPPVVLGEVRISTTTLHRDALPTELAYTGTNRSVALAMVLGGLTLVVGGAAIVRNGYKEDGK
jgi:hypothetical protein